MDIQSQNPLTEIESSIDTTQLLNLIVCVQTLVRESVKNLSTFNSESKQYTGLSQLLPSNPNFTPKLPFDNLFTNNEMFSIEESGAWLSIIRPMVALFLLERVPFSPINSSTILNKLLKNDSLVSPAQKNALLEFGGESGAIFAVDTALWSIGEDYGGVELDELVVNERLCVRVMSIDRTRLLAVLPETGGDCLASRISDVWMGGHMVVGPGSDGARRRSHCGGIASGIPDLYDDVICNIFSRLPARSAARCRLLSRGWNARLSELHFVNSHLFSGARDHFLLNTDFFELYTVDPPIGYDALSRPLPMPYVPGIPYIVDVSDFLGSCRGLVLMEDFSHRFYLVNPTTRSQVMIPPCPVDRKCLKAPDVAYGLGYDEIADDYKIMLKIMDYDEQGVLTEMRTNVYALREGVWRVFDDMTLERQYVPLVSMGVYLNGRIHWIGMGLGGEVDDEDGIVIFDMESEEAMLMGLPAAIQGVAVEWDEHMPIVGRECLFSARMRDVIYILESRVMGTYGDVASWRGFGDIDDVRFSTLTFAPLCTRSIGGVDEILSVIGNWFGSIAACNVNAGLVIPIDIDGLGNDSFCDGIAFVDSVESLVR